MLDHIFLTVSDMSRSVAFYTAALAPLGMPTNSITTARTARPAIPT